MKVKEIKSVFIDTLPKLPDPGSGMAILDLFPGKKPYYAVRVKNKKAQDEFYFGCKQTTTNDPPTLLANIWPEHPDFKRMVLLGSIYFCVQYKGYTPPKRSLKAPQKSTTKKKKK